MLLLCPKERCHRRKRTFLFLLTARFSIVAWSSLVGEVIVVLCSNVSSKESLLLSSYVPALMAASPTGGVTNVTEFFPQAPALVLDLDSCASSSSSLQRASSPLCAAATALTRPFSPLIVTILCPLYNLLTKNRLLVDWHHKTQKQSIIIDG
jgi:hypothetical protein